MDREQFVQRIQVAVYQSAVNGTVRTLNAPSGRKPASALLELSKWYNNLPEADRARVDQVAEMAARSAVFGFLCVLDHVRSIKEFHEPETTLELTCTQGTQVTLLNTWEGEHLHDIFNGLVPPLGS